MKTKGRDVLLGAAVFLLIASCSGNGCDCVGAIPGGFPAGERVPNAIQVRISSSGLSALETNSSTLVSSLVGDGGGLTFEVPPACGADDNPQICCSGGTPDAECGPISIDLEPQAGDLPRMEIVPVQGSSRLDVSIRARVVTVMPLPIIYTLIFPIECDVNIDTEAAGPNNDLLIRTQVDFKQDPDANTTFVEVGAVEVLQLDDGDLFLSGNLLCDFANALVGTFTDSLITTFQDAIRSAITDQLCKQCPSGDVAECGGFADSCDSGVCMKGGACFQELGVSGRVAAGALFGNMSPGTLGAIDIYDVAGGYSATDNSGLSLGLLGGLLPAGKERDRCGPSSTPPADVTIPQSAFFQGNTRPDTGGAFDFAFGVHQHNLDLFSYSAYESGLLCLTIGTSSIDLLTSDTMALAMQSVVDLLHGEVGQMFLGIRPQQKPEIVLGLGTYRNEGGQQVIDEPLLDITMDNVDIDFFAQVDDQFVRVMTLNTDIKLPMNLQVTADGELEPVMGDLENAFTNITVRNSEALLETETELADKFPALLTLALPFIADGLGAFALPELGGLILRIDDDGITAVDNKKFLAIFGTFEVAPPTMANRVNTTAKLVSVTVPDTMAFSAKRWDRTKRPKVELELGGDGTDMEWAFRINKGPWSPYTTSPQATLSRRDMWLQGRHRIEVRARERGKPRTTDKTPVVIEALIDTVPPTVSVKHLTPGMVRVVGHDNVSSGRNGKLVGQYRFLANSWSEPATLPLHIDVTGRDVTALQVRVADEVGNDITRGATPIAFHGSVEGDGGCGCATGGDDAPLGGLALVLLVALGLSQRTRRLVRSNSLITAAALLLMVVPGCSCSNAASNPCGEIECLEGEVDRGPTGRWNAIASDGTRTVVSAYEESKGDLLLIDLGETGEMTIDVVDGVPNDTPAYDPTTYRGGVVPEGVDVGAWTSVALHNGFAHIAYQDRDNGHLKYAVEIEGGWQIHVVDTGMRGEAGLYTSLIVAADGTPAIAYMAAKVSDQVGGKVTQLRYAQASMPFPQSDTDWSVSILDEAAVSCAGLCATDDACVEQQTADGPQERCITPTQDCVSECGDTETCFGGACVAAIPAPPAYDMPHGVGLFANQTVLADGRRAIVYYDRSKGDLMMQLLDTSWTKLPIDAAPDTDTGQWADVVADDAGTLHIAYQDALGDQLLYRTWNAGGVGVVEVVDDGVRSNDTRPHAVGASATIFIDSSGQPAIAYQDGATSDLVIAHKTGSGWVREDLLVGAHLDGFHIDVAKAGTSTHLSSYQYDRGFWPPGDLLITTIP